MSAELPIAAVSFFFQAFAGCIQGYELISDACRLEKNAERLLVNFKLEKHRFINWAKLVQLDFTEEHLTLSHMSRGMVMDVMNQQEKLFTSFGRLDARYKRITSPLLKETDEPFEIDSNHLLENGTSTLTPNDKGKAVQFPVEDIVKKALDWLSTSRTVPKRIRWASFDHKKMEGLIAKLSTFNDKMKEALDQAQMKSLYEMQTRTNYQIVLLNRHMDNMVQIFQAQAQLAQRQQGRILDMEDSDYDLWNGIAGPSVRRLTQPLEVLAQQKYVHLAIEDSHHFTAEEGDQIGLPHLAQDIGETEISIADITDWTDYAEDIEEGERTEAKYKGNSVWIEWKHNETAGPGQPDGQVDPKIRSRVTKLAALLKQNNRLVRFRAPHCLGYFVDDADDERVSRFGLVFEKPANVPKGTKPTSLRSLIEASHTPNSSVEIPSLTDRVTLMRLLAETIERLHAVDWLHKGLRSSNILFFETTDADGDETIKYADPYVSGFDYSRPATSDELTERPTDNPAADIYRHPIVQSNANREESSGRESYKKSYDLYSLGIVLLEIAYWKTIDQILGIDIATARPKQTWPVKERLLTKEKQHLRLVKSNTGNTVESVIKACLEGPTAFGLDKDCDEKRDVVAAHLQTKFGELVVKKLASMKGL